MKKLIASAVLQYLFLMIFFLILRALFLLYHVRLISAEHITLCETLMSFWHALRLDTATAAYLLIFPVFILFLQGLFGLKFLNRVNRVYIFLVILLWSLITVGELGVFSEWKFKLNSSIFLHLQRPAEVYYSISAGKFFGLLALFILLTAISYFLYWKVFFVRIVNRVRRWYLPVLFFLVMLPLLFVTLRGGFNRIPISQSAAHYSQHSILNWAAVNSGYQLAVNIMETSRYEKYNAYAFYEEEEAREVTERILLVEKDTTVSIINTSRPNVVMIVLESWTADLIESLGAEPGITPRFRELEKEGLLFTRFYCTGNRSHEAIASLLGGHPALPYTTFTANPQKFNRMPSMIRVLNEAGYHTSFYYGGVLDYGNLRAYALFNQFDEIIEEKDIDPAVPRGRLGVHDEFLFQVHLDDLAKTDQPFFSLIFTSSSHSPYDFPMEPVISWGGTENPFLNSAYYTDQCLGEYMSAAKKTDWYDNTLFILVADHGHNSYRNWRYESYEFHHIPLLFYGKALREEWRGVKSGRISDNSSVTKTLLKQLGLPAGDFRWSSDLFNPYAPEYAYMVLNNGYAWKTREGEIVYSFLWSHFYKREFPEGTTQAQEETFIREGKSFVQELFREFLAM